MRALQRQCCKPLWLDRHYLTELDQMCVAGQTPLCDADAPQRSVDGLRVALARRFGVKRVRPLPTALLRLYFADQAHFALLVTRVPTAHFATLVALANPGPAGSEPTAGVADEMGEAWESPETRQQRALLLRYLRRVVDACFCSFERCLSLMAQCHDAGDEWPLFGLQESLRSDPYWAGMASTDVTLCPQTRLVQLCWLWRCHVTLQLARLVQPWRDEQDREWLLWHMQLFRDTHLELATQQVTRSLWLDSELVDQRQILGLYWPAADRVCCWQELPCAVEYALDNQKTGVFLKERSTLPEKLGHVFFNKTMNNICKERNFHRIVVRYGEQDEIVYDLVKLVARCVLLGNVPHARGTLSWMARIRLTASMWGEQADSLMSDAEQQAFLPPYCDPRLVAEAKRQRKIASERARGASAERIAAVEQALRLKEEKARCAKTRFNLSLLKCPYFYSSLLKEWMFCVLEQSYCLNALLELDAKLPQYKHVVRLINARCRQELSLQLASPTAGPTSTIDWSVMESIERVPGRDYCVKRGHVMEGHAQGLPTNKKVFKRSFQGIIDVKATGIEEGLQSLKRMVGEASDAEIEQVCSDGTPATAHKPTLEQLHFVCWCMATSPTQHRRVGFGDSGAPIETRWFQVLGMSKEGLDDLRAWLFKFHTYDVADDSFKKSIRAFQQRSMLDYLLMKTVFRLLNYYRRKEQLFLLPAPFGRRQIHALRQKQMRLQPWEPTPALLGVCYQCQGCLRFANAVVPPLDYPSLSNYSELTRPDLQVYTGHAVTRNLSGLACHHISLVDADRYWRVLERCQTRTAQRFERRQLDDEKYNKELADEEKRRRRENISYLNVAFYNVTDGLPYCVRNRRQRHQTEPTGQSRLVLRSLHNGTRITAHTLRVTSLQEQRDDMGSMEEDDDDASSGEECAAPVHHDDGELRAHYEGLALAFNPSARNLRREAGQRMAQLSSLMLGQAQTPPPVENNKKRILSIVQQPLQQVYSCQSPMQPVDMISVVKNGKTLCVECGVMTELQPHGMTARGPVCTHHCDPSWMRHHPVWEMDTASAAHLNQKPAVPTDAVSDDRSCEGCTERAMIWLPCLGERMRLSKHACCRTCYRRLKPLLQRDGWVPRRRFLGR